MLVVVACAEVRMWAGGIDLPVVSGVQGVGWLEVVGGGVACGFFFSCFSFFLVSGFPFLLPPRQFALAWR